MGSVFQHRVQVSPGQVQQSLSSRAAGDITKELVQEGLQFGSDVFHLQGGGQQADAAIDVEAYAARRHDAFLQVGGRYAANTEPIALVGVGHGQRPSHQPRKGSHVGHLFLGQVLADLLNQRLAGIDQSVDSHSLLVGFWNQVAVIVQFFQHGVMIRWHFSVRQNLAAAFVSFRRRAPEARPERRRGKVIPSAAGRSLGFRFSR